MDFNRLTNAAGTGGPSFSNGLSADQLNEAVSTEGVELNGQKDGGSVTTPYQGEYVETALAANVNTSGTTILNIQSISLGAGLWFIEGMTKVQQNTGGFYASANLGIDTASTTLPSDFRNGRVTQEYDSANEGPTTIRVTTTVNISSTTTYYLNGQWGDAGTSVTFTDGFIRVIRMG